jgi:hypothetical protein
MQQSFNHISLQYGAAYLGADHLSAVDLGLAVSTSDGLGNSAAQGFVAVCAPVGSRGGGDSS